MATFCFTRLAEADLLNIGAYTLRAWGEAQTIRYLDELEACCQQLEAGKHVIFFRREPSGIVVSRHPA